jgi:hypothetical protein
MIPRFQFRLRTLFVIVTFVAVQCAVCLPALREWQHQRRVAAERDELVADYLRLTTHGTQTIDDYEIQ